MTQPSSRACCRFSKHIISDGPKQIVAWFYCRKHFACKWSDFLSVFPSFCFERRPDPWLRDLINAGTLSLFTFPFFRWTLIYMETLYDFPVEESPTTAESKRDGALEGAARHLRWNFCLLKPVKSPGEKGRGRGGGERVERRDLRCKK